MCLFSSLFFTIQVRKAPEPLRSFGCKGFRGSRVRLKYWFVLYVCRWEGKSTCTMYMRNKARHELLSSISFAAHRAGCRASCAFLMFPAPFLFFVFLEFLTLLLCSVIGITTDLM